MNTLPDTRIWGITSREIIDSRATPTIETTVYLNSGYRGTVSIPSGASIGKYEALELRDNDKNRFDGKGVLNAIGNVTNSIAPILKGIDARDQNTIDAKMIALDGTETKEKLGANAILSVSMACAVASARAMQMPLYSYFQILMSKRFTSSTQKIPTPIFNIINGGKHGAGNLNFQEFQVIPASNKPYHTALEIGVIIYNAVKQILLQRNAVHSIGDEGGFAPNLFTNADALAIIQEAIKGSPYTYGLDVYLGLDVAASHFFKGKTYEIRDRQQPYSTNDFISYLQELQETYNLLLLEDVLDEDDWSAWISLTKTIGSQVLIVGDDLLVTNKKKLEQAIKEKACSAILLKPNQVGSLSEFLDVVALAKQHDFKCIVSHRSGETTDTWIADLAVGIAADYVKFGAPARGERIVKYNRLSQIADELKSP